MLFIFNELILFSAASEDSNFFIYIYWVISIFGEAYLTRKLSMPLVATQSVKA